MVRSETYYSLVRVTNAIGYQYIIRSDGVTIQDDALLPGRVYDGDIAGIDLNYLPTKTSAYANWHAFGLPPEAIVQIDVESGDSGLMVRLFVESRLLVHANKNVFIPKQHFNTAIDFAWLQNVHLHLIYI